MPTSLRVIVPPHPLISHWLTILRNDATPSALYSTALEEMGRWLTYEAIREWLPHKKESISTSNGFTEGDVIDSSIEILCIPIIPGGLALWQGARGVLPNASLSLGGIPDELSNNSGLIIYIDQITTGQKLLDILQILEKKKVNPNRLRVITALSSSPGLQKIGEIIKDLNIYCACIDPELKTECELIPGIGNPSLRINTIIKE